MSDLIARFPMLDGPSIDWQTARDIYRIYSCLHGTDQSLVRIAERGGFGWVEVPLFLAMHEEYVRKGLCTCPKERK